MHFPKYRGVGGGDTVQLADSALKPPEPYTPDVSLVSCSLSTVFLELSTHKNAWGPVEGRELAKSAHVHGSLSG